MDEDRSAESPERAAAEGDRVVAALPDQLARARAVLRRAREQLAVQMNAEAAGDGV